MRQAIITGSLLLAISLLFSCSKTITSAKEGETALLGKWNILYDNTYVGVGINNHSVNYTGQSGDYFDFRADSTIYVKEGAEMDTLTYYLTSGSTAILSHFGAIGNGIPDTCHFTISDNSHLLIVAPDQLTPGGTFGRKTCLQK